MRGGTPAPSQQYRQKQVNTSLGLRNVGAQYIERSISNEWINTARWNHHTVQTKGRKCRSETRSKIASFWDKRYPTVEQKYALILQNRKTELNQKKPFLNINDTNVEIGSGEADLLELYAQAHQLADKKKGQI